MCLTVDITRTDPLILSPLGSCEDTGEAGGLEPQWPGGSEDCLEERRILSEKTCKLMSCSVVSVGVKTQRLTIETRHVCIPILNYD